MSAVALVICFLMPVLVPAESTAARIEVRAAVPAYARIVASELPGVIDVGEDDISRGYVDMPGDSRVEVMSNSRAGFSLDVVTRPGLVEAMRLIERSLPRPVELSRDGGTVAFRRTSVASTQTLFLRFHFGLADDLVPGRYPFPVVLQVAPLSNH